MGQIVFRYRHWISDSGHYSKRTKCCYIVIASDQREPGNLAVLTCTIAGLPRRFASRNDTAINAFVLVSGGRTFTVDS